MFNEYLNKIDKYNINKLKNETVYNLIISKSSFNSGKIFKKKELNLKKNNLI